MSAVTIDILKKAFRAQGRFKRRENKEIWKKLFECYQDGFLCEYCGIQMDEKWGCVHSFTIDHIIPKAKGGLDVPDNIVIACSGCNNLKSAMSAKSFKKVIAAIRKECGDEILEEIEKTHAGLYVQQKKKINFARVVEAHKNGVLLWEIAENENVDYTTLTRRLREKGIKLGPSPMKKINFDRIAEAYKNGVPVRDIIADEHVNNKTLKRIVQKAGIKLRSQYPKKKIKIGRAIKAYKRGIPVKDIAADERISIWTLKTRLREAGVEQRPRLGGIAK